MKINNTATIGRKTMPYIVERKTVCDARGGPSVLASHEGRCVMCGQDVYYDMKSVELARQMGDDRMICRQCFEKILDGNF